MLLPAAHRELEFLPPTRSPASGPASSPCPTGRIIPILEEEYCSEEVLDDVLDNRFSFNGECYSLGADIDWLKNPSRDIEWQILLHKFYFAPGLARRYSQSGDVRYRNCFEKLVRGWTTQTLPGFIAADVTARRIQNWIYAWHLFTQDSAVVFSADFQKLFTNSLVEQVNYVCEHLASKRNHRTLELYAIFLAAVAIPGIDNDGRWRQLAVREMTRNIQTDLLPDGVHCELSTDYHHIVLRSYLLFYRLAKMNGIVLPADISSQLCRALDFAMHIHRPDGKIPALSDSDSRSFYELLVWGADLFGREDYEFVATAGAYGKPPERSHSVFSDSGYTVLRSPWKNREPFADARYLVFDCGPVGAGNHGHLDALNVEIAAYGKSLIVDPGRYTYDEQGDINWRARFRQTSAHNTVTVDNVDQAIYKRCGAKHKIYDPRPECTLASADLHDETPYLHGFIKSPNYDAVHHRHIWFVDTRFWVILDRIRAEDIHRYELRYQLSPQALGNIDWIGHEAGREVISPGLTLVIAQKLPSVYAEPGFVSCQYGSKQEAPRICAQAFGTNQSFLSLVYPNQGLAPGIRTCDTGLVRTIEISDGEQPDGDQQEIWQWDYSIRSVSRRKSGTVRTWQMPEAAGDD